MTRVRALRNPSERVHTRALVRQARDKGPVPDAHVEPFICRSDRSKALHFSIDEVQSRMQVADPCALDLEYTRTMMAFLLFVPQPRCISMIGLGGGSLVKFCHRHLPAARIQVVEINPHVIALRDEFVVPADDERLTVMQGDGALFVRATVARSDVLLVDGFDYDGQPSALSSQAFYDDCHQQLQAGGLLVVNLHNGHARFDIFVDRMRRSFDDAVLVVEGNDPGNSIVFACKGKRFESRRPKPARVLAQLDARAAEQLRASFELVMSALTRNPR